MTETPIQEPGFLEQLTTVIENNIANEQFGVSELAGEMNMSRSNLLRKVKKESKLSVSQLIGQVRLKRAMELLRKTSANVSEVSHQVGFNSTSYFIKCFREYYGYPPGEVGKRDSAVVVPQPGKLPETLDATAAKFRWGAPIAGLAILPVVVFAAYLFWTREPSPDSDGEKSIAVLPFKNDSNDSTNLYLINGLMESILDKLHKIEDLRVVSRTSVEKYRNTSKTIPEMARDLNVKYFVEGSGQKMGDRILLNIQLIDATTDKHIWSKQYRREANDIFELQQEIAKNIMQEIQVFITPEEKSRIEKKPTDDAIAYDYYLKARELFYRSGRADLEASIPLFLKAIERDPEFSLAYATAAMVYYYLDIFNLQKPHAAQVEKFAEKALLYDPKSSESMTAKALSLAIKGQYELSIPYFERALEFDPRSGLVLHFLTEFYNIHVPHPPKYLGYAIQKVKFETSTDSNTVSFNYFHLSNALLQNGFLDEALVYSQKSLRMNPKSFFGGFVNDYIHFAKDRDPLKARERLRARWQKDTLRFDILQEIAKVSTMAGDYGTAVSCYDRSLAAMRGYGMDIFKHEYLRMALAYEKVGQKEKAQWFLKEYQRYAESNLTMYKDLHLATLLAYQGQTDEAMKLFKRFAKEQDNFLYWLLLMPTDPTVSNLQKHPDFAAVMKDIERKYWKKHEEMKEKYGEEIVNIEY
jgi:TolB-like protein/AraC-like DNA-binding protein